MYKFFLGLIICIIWGSIDVNGQSTYPSNVYYTSTGRKRNPSEVEAMQRAYDTEQANKRISQMRSTGQPNSALPTSPPQPKLSKEDKNLILPSEADQALYKQTLKMPKTKMIRLLNSQCFEAINNRKPVDPNKCRSEIPGFGAMYSFRNIQHSYGQYADIQVFKGWFITAGFLTQGIIVSLGKVDFEKMTLMDKGVKFLTEYTPAETVAEADKQKAELEDGIQKDDFYYSRAVKIKPDEVYAMRSTAYHSKVITIGDKRNDTIVIFKVINQDENGNVTLIWRELQSKDAPNLK